MNKNFKFGLLHKCKVEKSYLILFMPIYCPVDIQYIRNIKRNKF